MERFKHGNSCIVCNKKCKEKQKNPSEETWKTFEDNAKRWKELNGEFKDVFDKVDWECGAIGYLWHKNCKWTMTNKKALMSAKDKFYKELQKEEVYQKEQEFQVEKRETRKSIGTIHDKALCIWCNKGDSYRSYNIP